MQVHIDETTCGPLCQHPACWQSNTRQAKGFPRMAPLPPHSPDIELDLPTVKVYNMLEDYGESNKDLYPSKYGGKPQHERTAYFPDLQKPSRQSIKVTRAPHASPKSSANAEPISKQPAKAFKVVEVQEVFDPEDLQATWEDTFLSKSYYVWVPNKKKKRRRGRGQKVSKSLPIDTVEGGKRSQSVKFKDVTEDMIPRELDNSRIMTRLEDWPVLKKKRASKSPTGTRYTSMTPRTTRGSSKMDFDIEGMRRSGLSVPIPTRMSGWRTSPRQMVYHSISDLLDLPRDVLVQVLENTRQSDLMSREKIQEVIKRFMPPQLDRGNTNISLASNLQQKKLQLHEGNKNLRQPQLMETKPVFYLDNDVMDDEEGEDEDIQRSASPFGSLKELYFGTRDLGKYKKPLPSIQDTGWSVSAGESRLISKLPSLSLGVKTDTGRAVSAGESRLISKLPSISLGLPELPSGIRQTKPFTYAKKTDFDFTLESPTHSRRQTPASSFKKGPVPTPPTSVRSTETPGSDHGTTIRVNVPSQASAHSERGSDDHDKQNNMQDNRELTSPEHPLHAVSPTFSTKVPNAPATTPANYQQSPVKSAPLLRDHMTTPPQEWPPAREKTASPLQIIRAPVNTPAGVLQEQSGLGTIKEGETQTDYQTQPQPLSRGRSVRFEIPEVPPPPSSPQLSDKDSTEGKDEMHKDPSRNTVTVNTIIPDQTPSMSSTTKPTSGHTVRTDANTINTSLPGENSFVKSSEGLNREISMVSSPEPWPQVNEKDFESAPAPSPEMTLHGPANTRIDTTLESEPTIDDGNQSRNAAEQEVAVENQTPETGREPSPEKEAPSIQNTVVNKTPPPTKEQSQAVKKLIEDSEKSESPAPPPPSPEPKDDDEVKIINKPKSASAMTPVMEETEHADSPHGDDDDVSVMVTQIQPKGIPNGTKLPNQRNMDTFVNIDIPATFEYKSDHSQRELSETQTIYEEPEPTPDEQKRDIALSVQSTLANRTISEQGMSEVSSSMIEPAMSQASQGPALSEDFAEKKEKSELLGDWSGVVIGSESQDTQAMLSSDKQEFDMTEEGGDHEGFKDDLRKEYEKITKDIESTQDGEDDNA